MNIRRSNDTIRDKLPEAQVNDELLREATQIAAVCKRSDIVLLWLMSAAAESFEQLE